MKQIASIRRGLRHGLLYITMATAFGLFAASALAADKMNPDADEILHAMSNYLDGIRSFTFDADISDEIITDAGQKLQFNSVSSAAFDRKVGFKLTRKGRFADATLSYDGSQLTLYGANLNAYMQKAFVGASDDALREFERSSGLALPGTDLLLHNPYAILTDNATSSGYYGRSYVGGVECHHLGFRTPKVDFQVWVDAGEYPLPRKYVITTKWLTGAPQYSVQLRNWNTRAEISAEQFKIAIPKGAVKLETLPVDSAGEIMNSKEEK